MEMIKRKVLQEKDRNIFIDEQYNSLGDYALLALLIEPEGKKCIPIEQVEALMEFMYAELEQIEKGNTRYKTKSYYYIENEDMLEFGGDNKYLPATFMLKKGISNLELSKRIVRKFDKRQLSVVLKPELVELLLSLLSNELEKNKIYQKAI